MEAIFKRTSVRKFAQTPVEAQKVERLLRAAMATPSAGNQQPWRFVVVDDAAVSARIAAASKFGGPAAGAPLNIVVVLDEADGRFPQFAVQDASACIENILLEAVELGLGAVWLGMYPEQDRVEALRETLGAPAEVTPFAVVAIGYPAVEPPAQKDRFDASRVSLNSYGNAWHA